MLGKFIVHMSWGGSGKRYDSGYDTYRLLTNVGLLKPVGYLMTLFLLWADSICNTGQCSSCLVLYSNWLKAFTQFSVFSKHNDTGLDIYIRSLW